MSCLHFNEGLIDDLLFHRFLTYGNDEILNMLLAINFIIDELQVWIWKGW